MSDGKPLEGRIIPPEKGGDTKGDNRQRKSQPHKISADGRLSEEEKAEEKETIERWGQLAKSGGFQTGAGYDPSDKERTMVRVMVFAGFSQKDIADIVGMSVTTLVKHFSWELEQGGNIMIADLAHRAAFRARAGSDTLTMFLLKTRGGPAFSEKQATAKELGEALSSGISNESEKAAIIGSVLDLLQVHRKEKAAAAATPTQEDNTR